MNRNSQKLRNLLLNLINKQKQDLTGLVSDPDVNFTRNRKIPYENMILSLLTMEGATLTNELLRQWLQYHYRNIISICSAEKENPTSRTGKSFSRVRFPNSPKR